MEKIVMVLFALIGVIIVFVLGYYFMMVAPYQQSLSPQQLCAQKGMFYLEQQKQCVKAGGSCVLNSLTGGSCPIGTECKFTWNPLDGFFQCSPSGG